MPAAKRKDPKRKAPRSAKRKAPARPKSPAPPLLDPLDRKRLAEAELAELKLAQVRGQLIDADTLRLVLRVVSDVLRATGEQLAQVYGEPARRTVADAVQRIEKDGAAILGGRS